MSAAGRPPGAESDGTAGSADGSGADGSGVEGSGAESPARDPEADAVDRADYDPHYDPSAPVFCEVCGAEMIYTAACKLKCLRCGYARDCSDP